MPKKARELKRIVSSLVVGLLFLGLFAFVFTVQPVRAPSANIVINPDGSISSPVPANITTSDNVTYTFTDNNYLTIIVNRSDIVANGAGCTLQVSGGIGFYLEWPVNNVTIKNTTITNSGWGIDLNVSYNDTLTGNNVTANSNYGIGLWWSHGDVLSGNNITANGGDGIYLEGSFNNTLSGNNITANRYGIDLHSSSGNVLSGNVLASNVYNFRVYGSALSDFMNDVNTSNLVDSKPVYYLINQSNIVISPQTYPTGIGYLGLVNCQNVTVQDLTLTKNGQGLLLANTTDSKITDNNVTANGDDGVDLWYSSGDVLSGNNITNNGNEGVYLYGSSDNTIKGNNIAYSVDKGIRLYSSSDNNTISGNNITNCDHGIELETSCSFNAIFENNIADSNKNGINMAYSSSNNSIIENNITSNNQCGIDLYECSNNTISGNNIEANGGGIVFQENSNNNTISGNNIGANSDCGIGLDSSNYNIISGNNMKANGYAGVVLDSSSGNTFYHNNFMNNTQQVYSDGLPNTWDNGYPSGGNYWSDYLTRYPSATEIDHTGIGDTPYVVDGNNTDYYPLMTPYETTPPTITILSPENKTYAVNASIPLTFTVDKFASWIGYCLDGQSNVTITGNTTLPILSDGWHHATVYANDTFGNVGSATVYFTVDTTKPSITNVVQDPLNNIQPDTVVKINATVTDATSGVKQVLLNCTFTNSTNTWYAEFSMTHLAGDIWNATIPPQPYGTNATYVIIAEDNAGNTITTEQIYGYKYEYPVVPEFSLPPVFFAFVMTTLLMTVAVRKKRNRT